MTAIRDEGDSCRSGVALELPRDGRTVDVRKTDVHQNQIRPIGCSTRDRLGACDCLDRPKAGGAKHVACELRVLLVVVDDQDEGTTGLFGHGHSGSPVIC